MEKLSSNALRQNRFSRGSAYYQRGAALLLALLLAVLIGLNLFISQISPTEARLSKEQRTITALAQAREALIGRAVADNNRPGSLPCPDTDNDGVENATVGNCTNYIGRLPYKTLRISNPIDGDGETLWYVLSSALRDNSAAEPINSMTPTGLMLDGRTEIAAIVFSPGPPLTSQVGRPSNNRSDYLDGTNASTTNTFISSPASPIFNDQALGITRDELFRAVVMRVLAEIRGPDVSGGDGTPPSYGLRRYYADNGNFPDADNDPIADGWSNPGALVGKLPWRNMTSPATATPPPSVAANPSLLEAAAEGWLTNNNWLSLVGYEIINVPSIQIRLTLGGTSISVKPCTPPVQPCP